jgi:hypothetical protein
MSEGVDLKKLHAAIADATFRANGPEYAEAANGAGAFWDGTAGRCAESVFPLKAGITVGEEQRPSDVPAWAT